MDPPLARKPSPRLNKRRGWHRLQSPPRKTLKLPQHSSPRFGATQSLLTLALPSAPASTSRVALSYQSSHSTPKSTVKSAIPPPNNQLNGAVAVPSVTSHLPLSHQNATDGSYLSSNSGMRSIEVENFGSGSHVCDLCDHAFENVQALHKHIDRHIYCCPFCSHVSNEQRWLRSHIMMEHHEHYQTHRCRVPPRGCQAHQMGKMVDALRVSMLTHIYGGQIPIIPELLSQEATTAAGATASVSFTPITAPPIPGDTSSIASPALPPSPSPESAENKSTSPTPARPSSTPPTTSSTTSTTTLTLTSTPSMTKEEPVPSVVTSSIPPSSSTTAAITTTTVPAFIQTVPKPKPIPTIFPLANRSPTAQIAYLSPTIIPDKMYHYISQLLAPPLPDGAKHQQIKEQNENSGAQSSTESNNPLIKTEPNLNDSKITGNEPPATTAPTSPIDLQNTHTKVESGLVTGTTTTTISSISSHPNNHDTRAMNGVSADENGKDERRKRKRERSSNSYFKRPVHNPEALRRLKSLVDEKSPHRNMQWLRAFVDTPSLLPPQTSRAFRDFFALRSKCAREEEILKAVAKQKVVATGAAVSVSSSPSSSSSSSSSSATSSNNDKCYQVSITPRCTDNQSSQAIMVNTQTPTLSSTHSPNLSPPPSPVTYPAASPISRGAALALNEFRSATQKIGTKINFDFNHDDDQPPTLSSVFISPIGGSSSPLFLPSPMAKPLPAPMGTSTTASQTSMSRVRPRSVSPSEMSPSKRRRRNDNDVANGHNHNSDNSALCQGSTGTPVDSFSNIDENGSVSSPSSSSSPALPPRSNETVGNFDISLPPTSSSGGAPMASASHRLESTGGPMSQSVSASLRSPPQKRSSPKDDELGYKFKPVPVELKPRRSRRSRRSSRSKNDLPTPETPPPTTIVTVTDEYGLEVPMEVSPTTGRTRRRRTSSSRY